MDIAIILALLVVTYGGAFFLQSRLQDRARPWIRFLFVAGGAVTATFVGWASRDWGAWPLWTYPIAGVLFGLGMAAQFFRIQRYEGVDRAKLQQSEQRLRYRPKLFDK